MDTRSRSMTHTCTQCSAQFEITSDDLAFIKTVSPTFNKKLYEFPPPTECPHCRMQIRLAQRNERHLYHRKCDLTAKQIIACYSTDKPFKVYDNDAWYEDGWNELEYGRDIDFSRPFFEQFWELRKAVPRIARILQKPYENSDYCNTASQVKNCYLLFSSNQDEDCYFGSWINQCKSCIDNLNLEHCELCYECVSCRDCYSLRYCRDSINCRDSFFLRDCQGCSNCFGCTNQVNKEYMLFNEKKTKQEYEEFLKTVKTGSEKEMKAARGRIEGMLRDPIVKEFHGTNLENSSGDYLRNCKNARLCFECNNIEDCAYCQCVQNSRNCRDYSNWGQNSQFIYSTQACGYDSYNIRYCNLCWNGCSELLYCDHSFSSKNSFGCVGLRKQEYCILNKKYSKEEYERLAAKLIEHMQKTGEYGRFFSPSISIYAYNETQALEQVPLTKDEVLRRKWQWHDDEEEKNQYMGPDYVLPDLITDVGDDVLTKILHCDVTGKPFKIIPQELKFYREMNVPVPRRCPDQRHKDRLALRNPRILFDRQCAKCKKQIHTSFAPERPEIVYCEACYLSTVY